MHSSTNLNFKTLFEEAPGSYVVFTPDLTIIAFSNSYLATMRTTREIIIGKKLYEVFPDHPDDAASSIELIKNSVSKAIQLGEPYTGGIMKYDFLNNDGTFEKKFWRNFFVPVKNRNNEIAWIIAKAEDVTEMVTLNEEKQQWKEKFSQTTHLTEELRLLSGHLQNARENERAHIAREVHDELGQQMTVIKMDVSWLFKKIGVVEEKVRQRMDGLMCVLDETIKTIRRISSELRPSLLDDMGIMAAIEWQLAEFEKRWGVHTHFSGTTTEPLLEDTAKIGLFRIFQESLTNVARHANAKNIWVSLEFHEKELYLNIKDDGIGFREGTSGKRTFGLIGMKERTMMMGGKYEIKSSPQKGTSILVTMPMHDS